MKNKLTIALLTLATSSLCLLGSEDFDFEKKKNETQEVISAWESRSVEMPPELNANKLSQLKLCVNDSKNELDFNKCFLDIAR